jgi:diaminopimelate decarboxylase
MTSLSKIPNIIDRAVRGMDSFTFRHGELYCEDVPVRKIAGRVGTPFYLYSSSAVAAQFRAFDEAFAPHPHLICFAVKANSNLAVLNLLGKMGAGADIVSGGELYRVLRAGIPAERIVYSGVGKTTDEIREALEADILMFNVESLPELETITGVARRVGRRARVSFRINPDVDPKTHPYISTGLRKNKFGLPMPQARHAYTLASVNENLDVVGIDCHIGSQLTQVEPFVDALRRLKKLLRDLEDAGIPLKFIDMGGGLGIRYKDERPPDPSTYAHAILSEIRNLPHTLIVEPGRAIVGNAGVLVTKVLYGKETGEKLFYIVDAAMNDLARPSLYQAHHEILPVVESDAPGVAADIVGPICETGDFLARERSLPPMEGESLLAVMSAGAYGFSMSSNYNSRPRIPEVLVAGDRAEVVRRRETYETLVHGETIPDS